jgi:hypothetical protein
VLSGLCDREKMERCKWSVFGMCVFVIMVMTLPTAMMADEWNKATELTFNEPIEVPGTVLALERGATSLTGTISDSNFWYSEARR